MNPKIVIFALFLCVGKILTQSAALQCNQVCDAENCVNRNCALFNCTKTDAKIDYCLKCTIASGFSSICKSFSSNSSNQVQYSASFIFFLISINLILFLLIKQ